ncbi:MAG: fumarylacetoacetate hydrolase family protein, partial [Acidimicrobiales bacterium]
AEVGFVVGVGSELGRPVPVGAFADHVFGVVLVNDWSARDIQAFEYVPLGPFLGKSFATSISAWVTPLAALDAAWVPGPTQEPPPLPYLSGRTPGSAPAPGPPPAHRPAPAPGTAPAPGSPPGLGPRARPLGLDLALEVSLNDQVLSRPPFAGTYWTPAQQLAHLTVNGASLRTGDLFASGTVSGPEPDQLGSLIELTWNGTRPLHLADGSTRSFLEDGDTVTITASAPAAGGGVLHLGPVTGTITPALP